MHAHSGHWQLTIVYTLHSISSGIASGTACEGSCSCFCTCSETCWDKPQADTSESCTPGCNH